MALRLAVLKSVFSSYNQYAFPLILFFVIQGCLLRKDKKEYQNLLIYEIFGILLLMTPFIGNKIVTYKAGSEANWPVYGILCIAPLTAYMIADALQQFPKKSRGFVLAGIALAVQMCFGLLVSGEAFSLPGEHQKLSKTAVALAENIDVSKESYVMAPGELAGDLREYSQEIRVFYNESYTAMQQDLSLLQREADYYGCNYVILLAENDNEAVMTAGGYENRIRIEDYVMYEKNSG